MKTLCALLLCLLAPGLASADLIPGLISDFEDGTVQGWTSSRNNSSNGGGFLVVSGAPQLAVHSTGINGVIDASIRAISVDLRRPDENDDLEMRLVLMHGLAGSSRWTSTQAQVLPADGVFRTYVFSILEADLTQVVGPATYSDLLGNLDRLMFRYDEGAPSPGGSIAPGTFEMDNVFAVPEPTVVLLLAVGLSIGCARARAC